MKDLKNDLSDVLSRLKVIENSARRLQNQNFADIATGARGRVSQLLDHPDFDEVARQDEADHDPQEEDLFNRAPPAPDRTDPPLFGATDPGAALQSQEAHRREQFASASTAPFPGTAAPAVEHSDGDKDTYHPGDPEFQHTANSDAGAHDPHNVDLNKDGTLQRAPGVAGTSDVRKD